MTPDNPEVDPKPVIGQLSVDAVILAKRLAKAAVGELVTYTELTALIGRNVQNGAYHIMQSARRVVLTENKIAFGTVENEGLRRLSDDEIAVSYTAPLKHISRTAKRAGKVVMCADGEKLSPELQRKLSTGLSILGTVQMFAKVSSQRAVEASLTPTAIPHKVSAEDMTKLFAKK